MAKKELTNVTDLPDIKDLADSALIAIMAQMLPDDVLSSERKSMCAVGALAEIVRRLTTRARAVESLTLNAHGLAQFADNHRKFVTAWSQVRTYLRASGNERMRVELRLHDGGWQITMVDGGSMRDMYEQTDVDAGTVGQTPPFPTLLGAWCERQMELARKGKGG